MQVFSLYKTKLSFKNSCMNTIFPDMLNLLLFKREHLPACVLVPGTHRNFLASLANVGYSSFLALHQSREFLSASKRSFDLHDIYSVYKREYKAEINSLGYDLAVLRLVIQSLGRVQAPWIDHRGRHIINFLHSKS